MMRRMLLLLSAIVAASALESRVSSTAWTGGSTVITLALGEENTVATPPNVPQATCYRSCDARTGAYETCRWHYACHRRTASGVCSKHEWTRACTHTPCSCTCLDGDAARGSECPCQGSHRCVKCKPGYHLKDGYCAKCANGFTSDGFSCSRNQCIVPAFSPHSSMCGCAPGSRRTGLSSCAKCPTATFQHEPLKHFCWHCLVGRYQDSTGSTKCKLCPAGKSTIANGKFARSPTKMSDYAEIFSAARNQRRGSAAACSSCPGQTIGPYLFDIPGAHQAGVDRCPSCWHNLCRTCDYENPLAFPWAKLSGKDGRPVYVGTGRGKRFEGAIPNAQKTKCGCQDNQFKATTKDGYRCQACPSGRYHYTVDNWHNEGEIVCKSCPRGDFLDKITDPSRWSCREKRCSACKNGEPATGVACPRHDGSTCAKCSTGYHLEVHCATCGACVENKCQCVRGTGTRNAACPRHDELVCASCDAGFWLKAETKTCELKRCTCEHGSAFEGVSCPADGAPKCRACAPGYWLDGSRCKLKVCACANGKNASGVSCPLHGAHHCLSCKAPWMLDAKTAQCRCTDSTGYYFDRKEMKCTNKRCVCNGGSGANGKACPQHLDERCVVCNDGRYLESHRCPLKVCVCVDGTGASGTNCPRNGATKCISCDSGYWLDSNTNRCEPKVCTCKNGSGATLGACPSNGGAKCASCDKGYFLDSTEQKCELNVCACKHGRPATGVACAKHQQHTCASCDAGYYLHARAGWAMCEPWLGTCVHGALRQPQAARTRHDQCGTCKPGYGLVGVRCESCIFLQTFSGHFDDAPCQELETCDAHAGPWGEGGEYEIKPPSEDATSDRVCASHSAKCSSAQWQSAPPTTTSDRRCEGAGSCLHGTLVTLRKRTMANQCGTCEDGYYLVPGRGAVPSTCRRCEAGYACTGSQRSPCSADTLFSRGGAASCSTCPAGSFTSGGGSDGMTRAACNACAAGMICPTGDSKPIPCSPGTFSKESATICTDCGADNLYSGVAQPNACRVCSPGKYTSGGTMHTRIACSPCEAGRFCPRGDSLRPLCAAGFFSKHSAAQCSPCGGDKLYSAQGQPNSCLTCPAGSHTIGGNSTQTRTGCFACPAGSFCDGSSTVPPCPKGHFSRRGSAMCEQCAADNMWAPQGEAWRCRKCPPGSHTMGVSPSTRSACVTCPAGSHCNGSSAKPQCPKGKFSAAGASKCSNCGADNMYAASVGTPDKCDTCSRGSFTSGGDVHTRSLCSPCAKGYECPLGNSVSVSCGPGFEAPNESTVTCSPCGTATCLWSKGTSSESCRYSSGTANVQCVTCGAGSYTTGGGGSATRTKCMAWEGSCVNRFGEVKGTLRQPAARRKHGHCGTCQPGYDLIKRHWKSDLCLDQTEPYIALEGDTITQIEASTSAQYVDAGAVCHDEVDGAVACVEGALPIAPGTKPRQTCGIEQKVSPAHTGTYTVSYACADRAGNQAVRETRTVEVVDTTPPELVVEGKDVSTYNVAAPYDSRRTPKPYVHPKRSCRDSFDGALDDAITVVGEVDITAERDNTVVYVCADRRGNMVHVSRVVRVRFLPIDGGWSDWSDWSACSGSDSDSTRKRTRACSNPRPQHGGKSCTALGNGAESQMEPCRNGGWTAWSMCTEVCGGKGTRQRECTNPAPEGGGADCQGEQVEHCNAMSCTPSEPCKHISCVHAGGLIQVRHHHKEHENGSRSHHCMWYQRGLNGDVPNGECKCLCNPDHEVQHRTNAVDEESKLDARIVRGRSQRIKVGDRGFGSRGTTAPPINTQGVLFRHNVGEYGTCKCKREYAPVLCSSDGLTYASPCVASCAKASDCAPPPLTTTTTTLPPEGWELCNGAKACPVAFDPVKCADGLTYSNSCEARCAKAVACKRLQDASRQCPAKCRAWFDGCNTCVCVAGKVGVCTKRVCANAAAEPARCVDWATTSTTSTTTTTTTTTAPCCTAKIAWCFACKARLTIDAYCADNHAVPGCEITDVCTRDARECADGSVVRRDPSAGCTFFSCSSVAPAAASAAV